MNSFAISTLIALCLFLNNQPTQSSWEKQAVAATQQTLASELDAELPGLSFADWFEKAVGPGTGVVWQLSECGEMVEAASNATGDMRACVEVISILPNGQKLIVMITVGTFKKGMTGAPAFHFGVIERKGELYPIRRLRDLQQQLLAPGKLANGPASKLPEVNMPKLRLAADNAYLAGELVWSREDFGRLMQIEEPPPAPPSKETSNAERRNISGGVLQGEAVVKPQPKYPQNARRFNASGPVEVRVTISVTGRVIKAIAISGHPLLREAAVQAARLWEFEPTLSNGVPVETELVLTFVFTVPQ